jgi:hypothetical protein
VWHLNPLLLDRHLSKADRLSSKGVSREALGAQLSINAIHFRQLLPFPATLPSPVHV